MIEVNLFDSNFQHTKNIVGVLTSTYLYPPKDIKWVDKKMNYDGITVFTDSYLNSPYVDSVRSKLKVAWLMEPPAIHPWVYSSIIELEDKFNYILTFEENLLKRSSKYIKYIVGQSRVPDDIANFYEKSRKISMISSGKGISDGHKYRHTIFDSLKNKFEIDWWGRGFGKPFNEKTEPLIDYEFSICVTNSRINNYFTEILIDPIRLGTIPIFWGCPNIGDYFDTRGMETFNTIEELEDVLKNLKPWREYAKYAKHNFEECKKYLHTDDYIAKILKQL